MIEVSSCLPCGSVAPQAIAPRLRPSVVDGHLRPVACAVLRCVRFGGRWRDCLAFALRRERDRSHCPPPRCAAMYHPSSAGCMWLQCHRTPTELATPCALTAEPVESGLLCGLLSAGPTAVVLSTVSNGTSGGGACAAPAEVAELQEVELDYWDSDGCAILPAGPTADLDGDEVPNELLAFPTNEGRTLPAPSPW